MHGFNLLVDSVMECTPYHSNECFYSFHNECFSSTGGHPYVQYVIQAKRKDILLSKVNKSNAYIIYLKIINP